MNSLLAVLFVIDVAGTLGGIFLMQLRGLSRKVAAISGGVMLGAALFWIWPDLTRAAGLEHSIITVALGVTALYAIDRFVYPVCPCCATAADSRQWAARSCPCLRRSASTICSTGGSPE